MAWHAPVPGLSAGDRSRLVQVLAEARQLGFLGPGPVEDQVDRSVGLLAAFGDRQHPTTALDLGSGGGLPGLVLAMSLPLWTWTLLDGSVRRTDWLAAAVARLDLGDRVDVVAMRAEVAGRGPMRGTLDVVVARGFAAPAPTAECAAPLLRSGGILLVTEPPGGSPDRWDKGGLGALGLVPESRLTEPVAAQVLRCTTPCSERFPRRVGIPVKRPLW